VTEFPASISFSLTETIRFEASNSGQLIGKDLDFVRLKSELKSNVNNWK